MKKSFTNRLLIVGLLLTLSTASSYAEREGNISVAYPVDLMPEGVTIEQAEAFMKKVKSVRKEESTPNEDPSDEPLVVSITTTGYGQLEALIEEKQADQATELIVSGPIDETDFKAIWTCAEKDNLRVLDLGGTQIKDNTIPDYALYHTSQFDTGHRLRISKIILPDEVEKIGMAAFAFMRLQEINIPTSLKDLGSTAFGMDYLLNCEIVIPEGVEEIRYHTFYDCLGLKISPKLPSTLKKIGEFVFYATKFQHIEFKEGLEIIGQGAFTMGGLTEISLPGSIKTLEREAFSGCYNMEQVNFSETMSLEEIRYGVFRTCMGMTRIKLPPSLKVVGEEAFDNCQNLSSVEFPEALYSIEKNAFADCPIETVVLPENLKYLESNCFGNDEIKAVYCKAQTPPSCIGSPFVDQWIAGVPLYVSVGCKEIYQEQWQWNKFKEIIETDFLTSVDGIAVDEQTGDDIYYDLTGMKVAKPIPGQLYIQNGRKVVFR